MSDNDKPGPSKRAMEQLAMQPYVKLRRVEEICNKNSADEYYIVTDVSDANVTVKQLDPVVEEPTSEDEVIELQEQEVTIKIEGHGCERDPLNINKEYEESSESSPSTSLTSTRPVRKNEQIPQVNVSIRVQTEQPPYLIELKKTLGKMQTLPLPYRRCIDARSSKKVSIPGPWTENDISMRIKDFAKNKAWLMPVPDHPANYFDYFIDDDYLNGIVTATNEQVSRRKGSKQDISFLRNWIDLTVPEFKVFIGLLLHTGTGKHKLLGDYWRQHRLYKSCFPDHMAAFRFTTILQYLSFPCFEREKRMNHNKLNHPMADNFNKVMKTIYYPGRELSISLNKINFDAPCEQEFPLKIVALHKLNEPIAKIVMDTRRNVAMDVEAVMCKLLEDKHKVGHAIYVDGATTAIVPSFVLYLLRNGTYCTGILDENRFQAPDEILRAELQTGESVSVFHDGLHIGKHRFKEGTTLYVTSEFKKHTDKLPKEMPEPLRVYNEMTSPASDPHCDILNYFPWKTYTMSPLKKMFIYTLLIGISNASKMCNMFSGTKHGYHAYRLMVLEHLLPAVPEVPELLEPPKRIKRSHKLIKIPKTAYRLIDGTKSVKFTARRDCKHCKNVKETRTNTIYQCDGCDDNPALCMKCFFELHSFDCV